jgi:hypothetical protein
VPALASGGTGDVLTGLTGALLAQRLSTFDAARLGAWVHGRAGALAAVALGPVSVAAGDVAAHLPAAFVELLSTTSPRLTGGLPLGSRRLATTWVAASLLSPPDPLSTGGLPLRSLSPPDPLR